MYRPIFHPQRRRRAFLLRTYRPFKTDRHRSVWRRKATGHIETRQYPFMFPLRAP